MTTLRPMAPQLETTLPRLPVRPHSDDLRPEAAAVLYRVNWLQQRFVRRAVRMPCVFASASCGTRLRVQALRPSTADVPQGPERLLERAPCRCAGTGLPPSNPAN